MRTLIDISLLLPLAWGEHEHHVQAINWLNSVPEASVCVCRAAQNGLLRLLTTRSLMQDDVLTMGEAWSIYDQLMADSRFSFCPEPEGIEPLWRALCQPKQIAPHKWADAYLAAFAVAAGMRLVTFDRGFREFKGLDLLVLTRPTLHETTAQYETGT